MALALVAHNVYGFGNNGGTSSPFNTGTCDLIVVALAYQSGSVVTFSDSKSNSYTEEAPNGSNPTDGGSDVKFYYAYGTNIGDSALTFTISGGSTAVALAWFSFTGAKTTDPFVAVNGANTGSPGTAVSSMQPGSINTNSGEVAITAMSNFGDTDNTSRSIDSSFTLTDQVGFLSSNHYPIGAAYKFQTGASENPTWSWSSGTQQWNRAAIITFAAAGSSPGAISYDLLKEDGSYLLKESGGKILLESIPITKFLEPGGDATFNVATTTAGGFWGTVFNAPTVATDFVHGNHIKSIKYSTTVQDRVRTAASTLNTTGSSRISVYVYFNAFPSATTTTIIENSSAYWAIQVTSGGVLILANTSNVQFGSNGPTLSTGQWYRISLAYTITDQTTNEFRLFVNGVSAISVSNTDLVLSPQGSQLVIGNLINSSGLDMRSSDHYIDDSSSLTDTGDIWVTAKRPNANGTTNGFTTQIGSGGSGYGTGHSPQVNERALSTTNGWSMIGAGSAVTEEYSIENPSTGDIDISSAKIADYMGWVYASAALSETGQIVVDNVTTNISLTSTNTMFTKYAGSAIYPNGGEDIGLVTSATVTTVSLYECGIVVAYIPASIPPTPIFTSNAQGLLLMGIGL